MQKSNKTGKVTLSDVARSLGVSAITVSRALRAPDKVSEALRERINRAVAELGYIPDPAARALASGSTNIIGVVIPSVTNYVFADVLRSIYDRIGSTGYDLQLANARYSVLEEEKLLRLFFSQKPSGMIVAGIDQTAESRHLLEAAACPIVQIMEVGDQPVDMMVGFSHRDAARAATRHLIERGYRRLGFVAARMDPRTQRRFLGFRDIAEAAGLFDERRVVTTPQASSATMGTALFDELMSRAPETDAVLCNNDDLALGVLFEAQRRRLRVPEQFGICGFNDFEIAAVVEPTLTSVRTFRAEMGEKAIDMLLAAIAGTPSPEKVVDLGFEVIHRRSTR